MFSGSIEMEHWAKMGSKQISLLAEMLKAMTLMCPKNKFHRIVTFTRSNPNPYQVQRSKIGSQNIVSRVPLKLKLCYFLRSIFTIRFDKVPFSQLPGRCHQFIDSSLIGFKTISNHDKYFQTARAPNQSQLVRDK